MHISSRPALGDLTRSSHPQNGQAAQRKSLAKPEASQTPGPIPAPYTIPLSPSHRPSEQLLLFPDEPASPASEPTKRRRPQSEPKKENPDKRASKRRSSTGHWGAISTLTINKDLLEHIYDQAAKGVDQHTPRKSTSDHRAQQRELTKTSHSSKKAAKLLGPARVVLIHNLELIPSERIINLSGKSLIELTIERLTQELISAKNLHYTKTGKSYTKTDVILFARGRAGEIYLDQKMNELYTIIFNEYSIIFIVLFVN